MTRFAPTASANWSSLIRRLGNGGKKQWWNVELGQKRERWRRRHAFVTPYHLMACHVAE
jgi:hypothetical protein